MGDLQQHWKQFGTGVGNRDHQQSGNWSPPIDPELSENCATCMDVKFVSPAESVPLGHPDFGGLIPCPECSGADSDEAVRRFAKLAGLNEEHVPQSFQSFDVAMQDNQAAALIMLNAFSGWAVGAQPPASWYPWAVILGDPGIGKTHLCIAAMWRLARRHQVSLYMDAVELANRARSFDDGQADDLQRQLVDAPWLLLDDVGNVHDPSGYVASVVSGVLGERHKRRMPTLITSNLTIEELSVAVDRTSHARIFDRFNDASLCGVWVLHKDLTSVRPKLGGTNEEMPPVD